MEMIIDFKQVDNAVIFKFKWAMCVINIISKFFVGSD